MLRKVLRRASLAILSLLLAACQPMPESYAPPIQRTPVETFRPYRVARIVNMNDGDAERYFVSDIGGLTGNWRWTGQRPAVKVTLKETQNIRFTIDFALADVTFQQTGPVNVTFFVNDHTLETVRYDKPGNQHFEKPVPAEWLTPDADTIAGAEIDKVFVSPDDGAKLGLVLTRIGLTQ